MPPPPPPVALAVAFVAAGGAVGSVLRYLISTAAAPISSKIPSGTLFANMLGCLLTGVVLFFVVQRDQPSAPLRLLLVSGFLGGLTTFSAFGSETILLVQRGQFGAAALNVAANVVLCLGAVGVGYAGTRAVA